MMPKSHLRQPEFPPFFPPNTQPVWGQANKLVSLTLLGHIPLFTLEKDEKLRAKMEKAYWAERMADWERYKKVYEENVFKGTTFKGNTNAEAIITKIFIGDDKAYVCYTASRKHKLEVDQYNVAHKKSLLKPLRTIKSGHFGLIEFLTGIMNKQITITSTP